MIAQIVTDKDGNPIDGNGQKLSVSSYSPPQDILKLFAQVQTDYSIAWRLQHREFDEFDGVSLLDRARMDQETFGAYVGVIVEPASKQWRWRGRKNTARNKILGILAHIIAGMLFPYVYAYNEEDEEDETTAKVMRILIEDHLKKADYEIKFLYMVLSALVNPAVHVEVEYVEALQRIKEKLADGTYKVTEAVDLLLSGIGLNIIPIDEVLPADFYTNNVQRQPYMVRVRRISYDEAKEIYAGRYVDEGKDRFDYVQAGKTRIFLSGQENQTLYDIDWTEADGNFVQEITIQYRPEDLEVTFVAGVFMGNYNDVYNSNPFKHRRMSLIGDEWKSIPVYNIAKSGFEPLDPTGRFYYYKSAAFKEFWDDASLNRMYQLAQDSAYLDTIKPVFLSGVSKVDQTVMVPGNTIAMPIGAQVTPYSGSPNIASVLKVLELNQQDMSESTQDSTANGVTQPGVTATATLKAQQNAQVMVGNFGVLIADLVRQIGALVGDCVIQHTTVGDVDATIPESLKMKFQTIMSQGKEGGKDVTNKIQFDSSMIGRDMTKKQADDLEWDMHYKTGGEKSSQIHYNVNPYKFARTQFSYYVDPNQIVSRSMGTDQLRKDRAFNLLMDPRVAPFINQQAVVDEYVIDEYADGDPDKFKKTPEQQQAQNNSQQLQNVMGTPPLGVPAGVTAPQGR